ncbi:hypothetical protein LIS82_18010 [Cytobacillus solani]|uniref:YpoC family protein n=1 Tax=Cytobacillus solani TaxID=1637975 RepID=UPI0006ABCCEB|nr:hypothetical protein [Cytobacillus solani]KOP83206.1 hypothetical protein AMS60_12410 [Bacillus sp. FJAT-21945]USK53488.1 hypothetical protein LIS82_18010 [Cytobacillus solani]
MSEQLILSIPNELNNPFFFSANERMTVEKSQLQNMVLNIPFLYEAAFYANIEALKPWQSHENSIPLIKSEWDTEKNKLEQIFTKRNYKDAIVPMKKGIGLFLQFVYWANDQPVHFGMPLSSKSLKVQPVNLEERIGFIIQRPALYHSFIQLNELLIEMEKQYVKHMAIKKASKQ